MLRGAIIGLGNVAIEGHLPGWTRRDDVEIVALSDTEGARRQPAEARLPEARWYDSPEDLLVHEPLDFVDICTPPASHVADASDEGRRGQQCERGQLAARPGARRRWRVDRSWLARVLSARELARGISDVGERAPGATAAHGLARRGYGDGAGDLSPRDGRYLPHLGRGPARQRRGAHRNRRSHRAPRGDAAAPARRPRVAVVVPARPVQRLGASRLVRSRGDSVPGRGDGDSGARRQPRRGPALQRAREPRARLRPPRRSAPRPAEPAHRMILVVVPSAPDGAAAVSPARVVAGLPLLTRIVRAATAAGYEHVFVRDAGPATRHLLGATTAVVLTTATPLPPVSKRRIVVVAANVVPQPRWLHALLEMPIEPERLYVDGTCAMAVETERAGEVLRAAARAPSAAALVAELGHVFVREALPLTADGRFPLASAGDVAAAETWLLRSLIKRNEGFMSRHFERRI